MDLVKGNAGRVLGEVGPSVCDPPAVEPLPSRAPPEADPGDHPPGRTPSAGAVGGDGPSSLVGTTLVK